MEAAHQANGEEPPPPYEERPPPRLPVPNKTTQQIPAPLPAPASAPQQAGRSTAPQVNRQFPPTFNLYRKGGFSRIHTLGVHQDQPLYAVYPHGGFSSEPDLVLHNGPSETSPPLATLIFDSWHRQMEVTLPPLRGATSEEAVRMPGFAHPVFEFKVHVNKPGGQGLVYEAFEWRRSRGDAVGQLGGRSYGWKLVRLANNVLPGAGGGEITSDGREVLAVCTQNAYSMSKVWKFEFTGTGASGALGERFAVMAVITSLGIWLRESRRKNSSASSGGSA